MNKIADARSEDVGPLTNFRSPYFSQEHEMLRAQVRRFVETEIKPKALAWEEQGYVPRDVLRRMGSLGFFGIRYPARYGGSEMDTLASVVLAEELGRSTFTGVSYTVLDHTDMASVHLFNSGSEAQRDKWMPRIISGEVITAVAVTEPDAGSDVKGIRTFARRDGDSYVIDGTKMFITNGVYGDLYFVAARTGEGSAERRHDGISMFLVERGLPGFSVSRKLDKMGMRASDTAELSFEECPVPAESLLGVEGRGFQQLAAGLQRERIMAAVLALSGAEQALEDSASYLRERQAFGTPLAQKQVLRHGMADMATEIEAARQLVYRAALLYQAGEECVAVVSMAKLFATEAANRVAYRAVQMHGGYGYMRELPVERFFRDVRLWPIASGTSEMMREIIARRLLS